MGKQGAKLTSVDDFLLKWGETEQQGKGQTIDEMKSVFQSLAGASIKNEKDKKQITSHKPKSLRK
jgi:hypothetical protein